MPPSDTTAASSSIRVSLLIENRLLRETLIRLLRKHSDITVAGKCGQADLDPWFNLDKQFDVLVVAATEIHQPVASIAFESILQTAGKTILIGMEPDEEQFLAAVRFGVIGYLLRDASASDVVAAVRAVFRGEAVCPSQLCAALFRVVAQARETPIQGPSSRPELTLRQQQLVRLVARGFTNKEIASHLNLSEFTVRNHIHRIFTLVDAGSRREAVEVIRSHGYAISP